MSVSPSAESGSSPGKGWSALLVLASLLPGFVLGSWLGAKFFVGPDAGLVGGAIVFWYGVLGMLAALVGAVLLVRFLAVPARRIAAMLLAAVTLALLAWLGLMFAKLGNEQAEQRRQTIAQLPTFELVLLGRVDPGLRRFAYDSQDNDWQVEKDDGTRCRGAFPANEAGDEAKLALLQALRGLDLAGVLLSPPDCQQAGRLLATLEMTIHEAKPPATTGRLRLTTACRNDVPEIAALLEGIEDVYRRQQDALACE